MHVEAIRQLMVSSQVCRKVAEHKPIALGDILTIDFNILSSRAHEVLYCVVPSQRLIDELRN